MQDLGQPLGILQLLDDYHNALGIQNFAWLLWAAEDLS